MPMLCTARRYTPGEMLALATYAVWFLACHYANDFGRPDAWKMLFSLASAWLSSYPSPLLGWCTCALRVYNDANNILHPRSRAITLRPVRAAQWATLVRMLIYWLIAVRCAWVSDTLSRIMWHFLAVNSLRIVHPPTAEEKITRRAVGLGDAFQLYAGVCVATILSISHERTNCLLCTMGVLYTASYMLGVRYPGGYCSPMTSQTGAFGLCCLRVACSYAAACTLDKPWVSFPAYLLAFLPHSDPSRQHSWPLYKFSQWLFKDKYIDDGAFLLWPVAYCFAPHWPAVALFIRSQPTALKHRKSACIYDHDSEVPFAPRMLFASTFHHWVAIYMFTRGSFATPLAIVSWSLGHPTFWAMKVRHRNAAWFLLAIHVCHVAMTLAGMHAWHRSPELAMLTRIIIGSGLVYRITWWVWTLELFLNAATGRVSKSARGELDFTLPAFSRGMCAAYCMGETLLIACHLKALAIAV